MKLSTVIYVDLEGTYIRSMNVGRYKYNYEDFYEKLTYPMYINKGRMTTTQGAHIILMRILSFLLFLS